MTLAMYKEMECENQNTFKELNKELKLNLVHEYRKLELMSYAMADEFVRLCNLADSKGFCESAELSRFIVDNQLGLKFQHLSGVLPMEREDGYVFDFIGGIRPCYYGALCDWLQLTSHGTRTRPIEEGFLPFGKLL